MKKKKKQNLMNSLKKTIFVMLSPYLTFFFVVIFLIGGLFFAIDELWNEFTSDEGISEINESSKGYVWPLPNYSDISSNFGNRVHPIKKTESFHDGIDIPAPQDTRIVSPGSGLVTNVYNSETLGKSIEIECGDYKFVFHHLYSVNVKKGNRVKKGEKIGGVGTTGTLSTGNHLHFTVYYKNELINPLDIINFNEIFNGSEETNNKIDNGANIIENSVNILSNNIVN